MSNVEFWAGDFGCEYLKRNRVNWRARLPLWHSIISQTNPNNVLEIGANAGWNLRAIRESSPGTYVCGIDVNRQAAEAAKRDGYSVEVHEARELIDGEPEAFDLVFTAGVLIHIAPEELEAVMAAAIHKSRRYVVAIEYENPIEQELEYRGHAGKLWKRPFGDLYVKMGLRLVNRGPAGVGFDRCAYWLLEKP